MLALTAKQKIILQTPGHLLVKGGPGSGKTTVAILKAASIIEKELGPAQQILFLSFARATVARIMEAIAEEETLTNEVRRLIDVDTYHAFFWRILKTHGYLVGFPRRLELMTPPNEAIALAAIRRGYKAQSKLTDAERLEKEVREAAERTRLAEQEGKVCFSLFAPYVASLLSASSKIRRLITGASPFIILDEFQDTSAEQWNAVNPLGSGSTLIALADPEQRIFEFAGAEAKRLQQYADTFHPAVIDLQGDNHRSKGTDIAHFGNDVLVGKFTKKTYEGVYFGTFASNANQAFARLHAETLQARARQIKSGKKHWTVAILVPTKRLTRLVSDALRDPVAGMPPIAHSAAVEMEGPILAAEFLAYLLQQTAGVQAERQCFDFICAFYRGKDGDAPTKTNATEADRIDSAYARCAEKEAAGQAVPKNSLYHAIRTTLNDARSIVLAGDPDADWLTVRRLLEASACPRLREMAADLRNVRLLERGTQLRQALSADWRANASYPNALTITRQAFVHEHFASAFRPEEGVIVMNMHKAKGKQFDEVIIFEGWPVFNGNQIAANPHRIVRNNQRTGEMGQARQNFRVSVTRAKSRTMILTPQRDRCVLLTPASRVEALE
jgi:DNA helicase II / ATP-dependent DNA helicase PcrA